MGIGTKVQINFQAQLLGHPGAIYCLHEAKKGFYSCGADGWLVHWDIERSNDGQRIATAGEAVYSMHVQHETCYLGTYSQHLIGIANGDVFAKIAAHTKGVFFIKTANENILSGGGDGYVCLWTKDLQLLKRVQVSQKGLRCAVWHASNWYMAGGDGTIYILDQNLDLVRTIIISGQSIFTIATLDNCIYAGGRDAKIIKMDADFKLEFWDAHLLHIHALRPLVDKNFLLSTSMDKTCRLWTTQGELLKVLDAPKYGGHLSSVNDALWLPNNTLVTCSDDKSIMVYTVIDAN